MEKARKEGGLNRMEPGIEDAFGRRQSLQLGIPSGRDSHRLFGIPPDLAESVIRAHIAKQEARLIEVNEIARVELDTNNYPEADTDTDTDTDTP